MAERPLTCEEAEILLATLAVGDGPPSDEERGLREHVARCRDCRDAETAFAEMAQALAVSLDPTDPPARVRTAVLAGVYREAPVLPDGGTGEGPRVGVSGRGGGSGRDRASGGDRTDRAGWRVRVWDRIPAGRAWTLLGVLVAVGSGMIGAMTRPVPAPVSTLVSSPVQAGTMRGVHGEMICDAAAQMCVIDVSGMPIPGAPGAAGVAYEVWLHRNGAMVAATYLTLADDGRSWTATLNGDMSSVADVSMTLEPERGAGSPGGPVVATVAVRH